MREPSVDREPTPDVAPQQTSRFTRKRKANLQGTLGLCANCLHLHPLRNAMRHPQSAIHVDFMLQTAKLAGRFQLVCELSIGVQHNNAGQLIAPLPARFDALI
jgi:hypothetical protein